MAGIGTLHLMAPRARAVPRAVIGAADQHVLRVLHYVDTLPDRRAADDLLAQVRDQLRQLRPPRPLRFTRVLFMPLDPVIVNAGDWRPGAAKLPRPAIVPISDLVHGACPAETAAVEAILADNTVPDRERIAAAGAILWPAAAAVLSASPAPADWITTALPTAAFPPLATAIAVCLDEASRLAELADPAVAVRDIEDTLETMLRSAQSHGAAAWGMLLTVMLQQFPAAEAPRRAAHRSADPTLHEAAAQAMEAAWRWIEAGVDDVGAAAAAEAASRLRRRIALLAALSHDPAQHARATTLQTRLRQACAERLEADLQAYVVGRLVSMSEPGAASPDSVDRMEEDMRDLLRLAAEARGLDGGAAHDALLQNAARSVYTQPGLGRMERARLIELLLGSAAAHALIAN